MKYVYLLLDLQRVPTCKEGFKELQYVDLQLDLQRTTTWKVVRYVFQSFQYVLRTVAILSWFVLDSWLTSGALSRLQIQFFFQNKKFEEGGQRVVAQERINVRETVGR